MLEYNHMKKLVPDFIMNELGKIKGAQAILLTGSRALGKEAKNSDWDFMVILKDGLPRWRKTYKIRGTWIELLCNDRKQIEQDFAEDLEIGRGVTTYMFATGKIVFDDKRKILKKLTSKAKKNWAKRPKPLTKEKLDWINYDISTYVQDIEDCLHQGKEAPLLINYAVNEYVRHYYRLGNMWLSRPKERLDDIKNKAPKLFTLIRRFERAKDWRAKARIAIAMGRAVGRKYRLSLDGELLAVAKKGSK